MNKTCFQ